MRRGPLTIEDVVAVARGEARVRPGDEVAARMEASRSCRTHTACAALRSAGHGAVRDVLAYARSVISIELGSVRAVHRRVGCRRRFAPRRIRGIGGRKRLRPATGERAGARGAGAGPPRGSGPALGGVGGLCLSWGGAGRARAQALRSRSFSSDSMSTKPLSSPAGTIE